MNVSHSNRRCPVCAVEIPADAPQALCPKCLLKGVASAAESPYETTNSTSRSDPSRIERSTWRGPSKEADHNAIPPSIEELAHAFPQLQIRELIGHGGMSYVYKARQPKLDRFVAIKILPGYLADEPTFRERFEREARVMAKLQHPAIVMVYDFGETAVATPKVELSTSSLTSGDRSHKQPDAVSQFFYLILEYVDGVNLREAMRAGRFTPDQALAIVPQVCEALQYAHSKGILHRDIKPENILLDTDGHVKIADFGIAKVLGPEIEASLNPSPGEAASESEIAVTRLTATGSVLGTPLYMAPEQLLRPKTVDHRADIFSLGVVFYEMLTGELPMGRFAPPSEKTLIDQRIDEVVLRALAKERELRQQSANEMKTDVETIVSDPRRQRESLPTPQRAKTVMGREFGIPVETRHKSPWARRFFWLAVSGVVVIAIIPGLIILVSVGSYLSQEDRSPHRYRPPQAATIVEKSDRSMLTPSGDSAAPIPLDQDAIVVANSTVAIEAERLGLIEVAKISTEIRTRQQPIRLMGTDGEVLIEPHFSALVELSSTTNQLSWSCAPDPMMGHPITRQSTYSPYPCDFIGCDWSLGRDRPTILGYLLSPGAYDFRTNKEANLPELFNSKDRSDIANHALQLINSAVDTSAAVSADWQKAAKSFHLRFRLVPQSISHLIVPEECLVEFEGAPRSIVIFARDGGRFTKNTISSTDAMRPLFEVIERAENRDEREAAELLHPANLSPQSPDAGSNSGETTAPRSNDEQDSNPPK